MKVLSCFSFLLFTFLVFISLKFFGCLYMYRKIFYRWIILISVHLLFSGCTTSSSGILFKKHQQKLDDLENQALDDLDNAQGLAKKDKSSVNDLIDRDAKNIISNSSEDISSELERFNAEEIGQVVGSGPSIKQVDDLYQSLMRFARNVVATGRAYQANLNSSDERVLEYLLDQDSSSRTSKELAVLYIALLEHGIVEYDHLQRNPDQAEGIDTSQLLIKLAGDYGIRIYHELKRNSYLHSPAVYHMTVLVIKHVNAAKSLALPLYSYIRVQAKEWYELHAAVEDILGGDSDLDQQVTNSSNSFEEAIGQVLADTDPQENPTLSEFSLGQSEESEQLIAEAKRYHSEKQYAQAIQSLLLVKQDSLQYNSAQQMIIKFSDDAVNELRKLAASSFQNYLRVNSRQKKLEYLTTAEKHLLDAISSYPDSKWLPKVRSNLGIIQERIATLEAPSDDQYED